MRTTIELRDDQRAALLAQAAQRGQKGFSALIEEAIDAWLDGQRVRQDTGRRARSLEGILAGDEGDAFAANCAAARAAWPAREVG